MILDDFPLIKLPADQVVNTWTRPTLYATDDYDGIVAQALLKFRNIDFELREALHGPILETQDEMLKEAELYTFACPSNTAHPWHSLMIDQLQAWYDLELVKAWTVHLKTSRHQPIMALHEYQEKWKGLKKAQNELYRLAGQSPLELSQWSEFMSFFSSVRVPPGLANQVEGDGQEQLRYATDLLKDGRTWLDNEEPSLHDARLFAFIYCSLTHLPDCPLKKALKQSAPLTDWASRKFDAYFKQTSKEHT